MIVHATRNAKKGASITGEAYDPHVQELLEKKLLSCNIRKFRRGVVSAQIYCPIRRIRLKACVLTQKHGGRADGKAECSTVSGNGNMFHH